MQQQEQNTQEVVVVVDDVHIAVVYQVTVVVVDPRRGSGPSEKPFEFFDLRLQPQVERLWSEVLRHLGNLQLGVFFSLHNNLTLRGF